MSLTGGSHRKLVGADLHGPSTERVENNTGSTINKLKIVKITTIGTIYPNIVTLTSTNDEAAGIVQADFLTATDARIMAFGRLNDVDTSSFSAAGVRLFADASGDLTETDTGIPMGIVLKKDASTGIIWIDVASKGSVGATGPPVNSQSVDSLQDPSPELLSLSGASEGEPLLVYKSIGSESNVATWYAWDTSGNSINPPYAVQGDGGVWIAVSSVYFDRFFDESLVDAGDNHGKQYHIHGTNNTDPGGGRWKGKHAGGSHEFLTRVRSLRTEISGTEIDFFQGDRVRFKTLSAGPTAFTIINAEVDHMIRLEIQSGAAEDATFEASVTEFGDYDATDGINHGILACINGGTKNSATFQITGNGISAGDGPVLAGVTFAAGTDWTVGASIKKSCIALARAMEDSTDVAVKHLFEYTFDGTDTLTIKERDSGSHTAFTLTEVDTGGNFTLSAPGGGAEPAYTLTWLNQLNAAVTHASTTGRTADDHHNEVHTIVSHDTNATGTQLTTLTNGSTGVTLHTHTQTKEVFMSTQTSSVLGNFRSLSLGQSAAREFTGFIPQDFTSITEMVMVMIISSGAAQASQDIDLFSDYASPGEVSNIHTESDTATTYDLSGFSDEIFELDISGVFSSIVAGDYFGIQVDQNSLGGTTNFLGIRLKYS